MWGAAKIAAGGMMRAGAGMAMQTGNPFAGAGGAGIAAAGAGASLATLAKSAEAVNAAFLETRRSMAQYNGMIAAAFNKLDVGRIQREIQSGNATAASTSAFADSQDRLEQAMQPMNNALTNMGNFIADAINEGAIFILDNGINPLLRFFGAEEIKRNDGGNNNALVMMLGMMGRGEGGGVSPGESMFRMGIAQAGYARRNRDLNRPAGGGNPAGEFEFDERSLYTRQQQVNRHHAAGQAMKRKAYLEGKAARRKAYENRNG